LKNLSSDDTYGNIEYYGKDVKLENLPKELIMDMLNEQIVDEYGCLINPIYEEMKDLTHDAYIKYDVWFDNGITIYNMERTLDTIDKIKNVIYGNEKIDKKSIKIIENESIPTCLDFSYCIKFNFVN